MLKTTDEGIEAAKDMETKCTKCHDSGWLVVKGDGREIARPCQCRRDDVRPIKVLNAISNL